MEYLQNAMETPKGSQGGSAFKNQGGSDFENQQESTMQKPR